MSADKVAEAFRILGVHCSRRQQLAEALLQVGGPWTLPQLALSTGISRQKIYAVTEPLRDLDVLQPTRPIEPRDWRIIYPPKILSKKRREYGVTGATRYVFNPKRLREALQVKAYEAQQQILSVLQEATT